MFDSLPPFGAWRHQELREGFEVAYFQPTGDGYDIEGCTTSREESQCWVVRYVISVDESWRTRKAVVSGRSNVQREATVALDADTSGRWWVDGELAPHLDGCLDVDLEASAVTNALVVRRSQLAVGEEANAPAAYVRAEDLTVERLEQTYLRREDIGIDQQYDYTARSFDFEARLSYDTSGLIRNYPGIAVRRL